MILCLLLLLQGDLSPRALRNGIEAILAEDVFADSFWGVIVEAPLRGKVLFERNPRANFRPASNLKIATTVTAFEVLGPTYRFETTLGYTGTIEAGTLHGDLVVTGGGDPSLSGNHDAGDWHTVALLAPWLDALAAHGIARVHGDLVARVDFFDDVAIQRSWEWDDMGRAYAVPVTPLALHNGWLEIAWEADADGVIQGSVWPEATPGLELIAELTSLPAARDVRVNRAWGTNRFVFSGNLPPCDRYATTRAAWDPSLQFLAVLREQLAHRGITVTGDLRVVSAPIENDVMDVLQSPDLADLATVLMKVSQNHYADLFLKTIGRRVHGEGRFETGAAVVDDLMAALVDDPGARDGHNIRDGSGLSAQNYLKPRQLAALLRHGLDAPWRDAWLATMPVMGRDGTLARRGDAQSLGAVLAKTGYIYRTRCLSGYVETMAGEPLIFVLMTNNYSTATREVERAQDQICALMRRLKPNRAVKRSDQRHRLIARN